MTNKIIPVEYQGYQISFNNDGWINATEAAKKFGKEPTQWLRNEDTLSYLFALQKALNINGVPETELSKINNIDSRMSSYKTKVLSLSKKTGLVKTKSGSPETGGGTWLHPKLAVAFARWLSVEFAVWCDIQIDQVIRQGSNLKEIRNDTKLGYRLVTDALKFSLESKGKEPKPKYFINEARLINGVITGVFKGRDRDQLNKV